MSAVTSSGVTAAERRGLDRRRRLVDAGREVFARAGSEPGSLPAIAARAGVRADVALSLFENEAELFAAVFEQEQLRTSLLVTEAFARRPDPWDGMVAALTAFLDRACDPAVQRITLIDGPGVLGTERAQEIGASYCLVVVEEGLRRLADARQLRGHDVPMLAHLLHGALVRAAVRIAHADDQAAAREETECELRGLVLGLAPRG